MNEACLNLFGEGIETENSRQFVLRTFDYMRSKLEQFQLETGNNYNLEATPAEGTSYRFAKIDKEKYPQCICANEEECQAGAEPFYTNSTQLSIKHSEDIFEVLDHQDDIQAKYTGGTVIHIFAGEKAPDCETVKNLVSKICKQYRLPYFTFSPTFSVCPSHGYLNGEQQECPDCGSKCEVYSRIVGYIRPVSQWNKGKKEEFKLRKTFKIKEKIKNCSSC
jgi:ribonucleoside-triphosphate reductase